MRLGAPRRSATTRVSSVAATSMGKASSEVPRTTLPLARSETATAGDDALQAMPGDLIVVTYVDERHVGPEARPLVFKAKCVEGSLGGVRVTQTQISDQELRVKTQLKTASALTNIGNRYKEFGLKQHADAKYEQALRLCEEVSADARKLATETRESAKQLDVPPQNIALFRKHEAEIKNYAMGGLEFVGL